MKKPVVPKWLDQPDDKDYSAARNYTELLFGLKKARNYFKDFKDAPIAKHLARDLLRASATPISEVQAFDWAKQQKEITAGTPLSPILLIHQKNGQPLIIADGFHRLCAVFNADQDAAVPCKIV